MRQTAEERACTVVITARPWRSCEQALFTQRSWIEAAIYLGLMIDDDSHLARCFEFVKKIGERPESRAGDCRALDRRLALRGPAERCVACRRSFASCLWAAQTPDGKTSAMLLTRP
jgi:hypothetical protein